MGFFDDVQSQFNRAGASVNRASASMRLKAKMAEALKRRQGFAAQLGASLYKSTRNDPALRTGREALYDGIAACDAERAQCQAEIDRIESESQAAQVAATTITCPFCGSRMAASDMFCSGCGKPIAEVRAALAAQAPAVAPVAPAWTGPTCPDCGQPVNPGDQFCMNCGHKFEGGAGAAPSQQ